MAATAQKPKAEPTTYRGTGFNARWGPGLQVDSPPPCNIPFSWQHQVAGWPHAKWSAWHRRTWELLGEDPRGSADVHAIADAHRWAYDEFATDDDRDAVEALSRMTGG